MLAALRSSPTAALRLLDRWAADLPASARLAADEHRRGLNGHSF